MVNRVIRDGKVAVIVSPGYGAGWSTWGHPNDAFDPVVVEWIEAGKPDPTPYAGVGGPYNGGLYQAHIEWLPEGTQFRIDEYDGSETLVLADEQDWSVA